MTDVKGSGWFPCKVIIVENGVEYTPEQWGIKQIQEQLKSVEEKLDWLIKCSPPLK